MHATHTHTHTHTHIPPTNTASFCQQRNSFPSLNMNLFQELLSNHTTQARTLTPAPYIPGMNTQTPAYDFSGTGISMTRQSTSDALRSASCSSSELTLYGTVFFKDSNSGGSLLDISYAGAGGSMMPVYGMYLDAEADSISLTYRYTYYTCSLVPRPHGLGTKLRLLLCKLYEMKVPKCALIFIICSEY